MKNSTLAFLMIFGLFLTSCTEDTEFNPALWLNGEYEGTFEVDYIYDSGFGDGGNYTEAISITFDGNQFNCTCRGKGTFSVEGNDVNFEDTGFYTADFDWNQIMRGTYTMIEDENQIIFTANKNNVGVYTYTLQKVQ